MKTVSKLKMIYKFFLFLPVLTGCAVGSATAGYSIKAKEAERLTPEGEQRLIDIIKWEIKDDLFTRYPKQVNVNQ